jgi:beta-lactamase regulating signal transducer with metallopeptidase domain
MSILRIIAISLLTLGLLSAITLLLIPLGIPQSAGIFPPSPERALWLLYLLTFAFGLILFTLAAKNHHRNRLSKLGGSVQMALGLAAAAEIFLLRAYPPLGITSDTSLWWLFVFSTVLGGIGVYIPASAKRRERKAEEDRIKRRELEAEALNREEQKRLNLRIVSYNVRR